MSRIEFSSTVVALCLVSLLVPVDAARARMNCETVRCTSFTPETPDILPAEQDDPAGDERCVVPRPYVSPSDAAPRPGSWPTERPGWLAWRLVRLPPSLDLSSYTVVSPRRDD